MISVRSGPGVAGYRELFAQSVLRRLAVADVCARLPQGMVSLTLLLVAAQRASMTVAGLVVAGYPLGQAATMNGGAAGGAALAGVASARPVLALGVAAAAAVVAAGAAGMHHAPFGKNDRRDRGGAVPLAARPDREVRRELVDDPARTGRGGRDGVGARRRHRAAHR